MSFRMHGPLSRWPLSRRMAAVAAIVAAGATGVTAVAGPAWATSGSNPPAAAPRAGLIAKSGDLATAKAKVDSRITKAISGIDTVTAALAKDAGLSAANRASLISKLAAFRQQLIDAKAMADGAPDVATLRAAVKGVLSNLNNRGATAQVRAAITAERMTGVIDHLSARLPAIEGRLNMARAHGVNVTAAGAALSDLRAKLADAHTELSGLADAVISGRATPADATVALGAATGDLKAAKADGQIIRTVLGGKK